MIKKTILEKSLSNKDFEDYKSFLYKNGILFRKYRFDTLAFIRVDFNDLNDDKKQKINSYFEINSFNDELIYLDIHSGGFDD